MRREYTENEINQIKSAYSNNLTNKRGWLKDLAIKLNRPLTNISRFAKRLGLTNRCRRQSDKICINCKKKFYTGNPNQECCSEKCGIIICSKKRIGGHIWKNRNHPRGMLGKHHSLKTRKIMSKRMIKDWGDKNSMYNSTKNSWAHSISQSKLMIERLRKSPNSIYSRTTKGWREFENGKRYYFRSKWEMNYAHYLEFLKKYKKIKDWTYEDDTFWFEKIKRGVRSYTPDFKITNNDLSIEYHEVKGWMDSKSKTKLKRMKTYHPDIKIILIEEEQYRVLKKNERLFKWE